MTEPPRVLITGAQGQVGFHLTQALGASYQVVACDRKSFDLSQPERIAGLLDHLAPRVIINAAAYTQVDRAESEPELAQRVNADAPREMARWAAAHGAIMIHYSTDYVFPGTGNRPYTEADAVGPINVYGRTKLAGDEAILDSDARAFIFRISWVYASRGKNFLLTMQRLARERDELRVVNDQHGSPTWAVAVAKATAECLAAIAAGQGEPGVYHMAAPDHTTWFDFARAIVDLGPAPRPRVTAVSSAEFPTAARRPAWSVLDSGKLNRTFGIQLDPWRKQLEACCGAFNVDSNATELISG